MDDEGIKVITLYIGAWSWRIIGFIFLTFSILFFRLKDTIFWISFFAVFCICEFIAWRRKSELFDNLKGGENE